MFQGLGFRKNVLYVLFNTNDIYMYHNVPIDVIKGLIVLAVHPDKGSIGKYFHNSVKKAGYPYTKFCTVGKLKTL